MSIPGSSMSFDIQARIQARLESIHPPAPLPRAVQGLAATSTPSRLPSRSQGPESQFEEQSEETPRPTVQAKATGAKGAKGAKGRGRKGKSKGQAKDGQSKDANMKEQAEKKNDGDPAPEAFTDPNAFPEAKPEEAQIEEEEEEEQESEEVVEDVEAVDEDSPAKLPVLKRPAIAKHFMKRPALKRPASQTDAGPVKPSEQSKATTETETKKVDGVDSVKPSKRSKATSETEKVTWMVEGWQASMLKHKTMCSISCFTILNKCFRINKRSLAVEISKCQLQVSKFTNPHRSPYYSYRSPDGVTYTSKCKAVAKGFPAPVDG